MKRRLLKLRSEMTKHRFDAVLVSSIHNIIYLTNFSGFSKDEREAFLFIMAQPQGSAHETPEVFGYILTDGRYSEAVRNKIKDFELVEISSKLTFEKALKDLAKKHKIKRVGFDHHNLTVAEHKKLSSCFKTLKHFSFDNLRTIKEANEISAIQKACKLGDKTFKHVLTCINAGISEKQLAFEIEFFIKKHGADISFPPIVAFGKNSSIPHHAPTNNKLTNNQIVLLDFGVRLNNYCSDMTRTVFLGRANSKQKKIYQTVLGAQEKVLDYLKNYYSSSERGESRSKFSAGSNNKIQTAQVDKIARSYIISQGFPTIPHSLGHGIGIEVHEAPRLSPKSKDILKPGMVFTIEPGIYVPGFGGVRIEDVVLLEEPHPRLLTKSSRDIIIL